MVASWQSDTGRMCVAMFLARLRSRIFPAAFALNRQRRPTSPVRNTPTAHRLAIDDVVPATPALPHELTTGAVGPDHETSP